MLLLILAALSNSSFADTVSKSESNLLHAEINAMYKAFEAGDASLFLKKTHKSIYTLVGGKQNFEEMFELAVSQLNSQGVKFVEATLGEPTKLYDAGNEEVCFVPRVSVIEVQGNKFQSRGFLIAIRAKGGESWSYLDGAGLRKDQSFLWKLLPDLVKNVELPANYVEAL